MRGTLALLASRQRHAGKTPYERERAWIDITPPRWLVDNGKQRKTCPLGVKLSAAPSLRELRVWVNVLAGRTHIQQQRARVCAWLCRQVGDPIEIARCGGLALCVELQQAGRLYTNNTQYTTSGRPGTCFVWPNAYCYCKRQNIAHIHPWHHGDAEVGVWSFQRGALAQAERILYNRQYDADDEQTAKYTRSSAVTPKFGCYCGGVIVFTIL